MAIAPASEAVAVAVFAKAPVAGYAKTRLVSCLGAEGAAALQERLVARALATAVAAEIGPVTLWCAPDTGHPFFQDIAQRMGVALAAQTEGDLGLRMLAAFEAAGRPLVLIGTDCPALTEADLRAGAAALRDGADAAIAPAEDGGYGLIAARRPFPPLFADMPWSTDQVAALTIARARNAGLKLTLLQMVWDVDTPADLERLTSSGLLSRS